MDGRLIPISTRAGTCYRVPTYEPLADAWILVGMQTQALRDLICPTPDRRGSPMRRQTRYQQERSNRPNRNRRVDTKSPQESPQTQEFLEH